MKKLIIASDHAGFEFKEALQAKAAVLLAEQGFEFLDIGTHSLESVDYPDYSQKFFETLTPAQKVPMSLENRAPCGVLICGSGVGVSIKANRYPEIRAVLAESSTVAKLARAHNHANVLCMGARIVSLEQALKILTVFLTTAPDEDERHVRRVKKLYE